MRVLVVTNLYPSASKPGLGSFVQQQVQGLAETGIQTDLVHLDTPGRRLGGYLELGARVRRHVAEFQPDLVHAAYGGLLAEVVTRAVEDRPTVVSFCGSDLVGEPLTRGLRRLKAAAGVWASRRAARRASGIIVKSRGLEIRLPRGLGHTPIAIIPSGIDLHRFRPLDRAICRQELGWEEGCFHVLFYAGGGSPNKRLPLARAAVAALQHTGTPSELHLLENVQHHEVAVWLSAADVVLLTSRSEGSPNIVKEALACDIPVVSVDVGDVRERLEGIDGCYLALPNPLDLAAKLAMVSVGPRRIAGRVRVQELSLDCCAERTRELYRQVLAGAARSELSAAGTGDRRAA